MSDETQGPATAFGAVAAAYEAGRPTFPASALEWILGPGRLTVLDLGAGTGKLSRVAAELGHDVIAIDPSAEMLAICGRFQGVDTMVGTAESIPLAHGSVDAVLVGQAFHWFEHDRALPEIARVLRSTGVLGLLWNSADTVVPWVRRLEAAVLADQTDDFDPMPILQESHLFGAIEQASFRHWHELDRHGLREFARSISRVAVLSETKRQAVLDQVDAIYRMVARPPEPVRVPYQAGCYRTWPSEYANYERIRTAPIVPPL